MLCLDLGGRANAGNHHSDLASRVYSAMGHNRYEARGRGCSRGLVAVACRCPDRTTYSEKSKAELARK
jgi:hypothetical protein